MSRPKRWTKTQSDAVLNLLSSHEFLDSCSAYHVRLAATMAPNDYAFAGSGKLKLKGVKDAKIDKKKKKKSSSKPKEGPTDGGEDNAFHDKSVMLKNLEDEDAQFAKEDRRSLAVPDGEEVGPGAASRDEEERQVVKTEAEKRHEEQRRKRVRIYCLFYVRRSLTSSSQLEDRLKREGVKTHKERVEELNRYLSSLSEHHDMPRIGPG